MIARIDSAARALGGSRGAEDLPAPRDLVWTWSKGRALLRARWVALASVLPSVAEERRLR